VSLQQATVIHVDELALRFVPWVWPFATTRRIEIDAHFAAARREKPDLYNGRVLLLREQTLAGKRLEGSCFETDFASLLAWRDWGFPDAAVRNAFGMAAMRGSDGAFLLGVMGDHTANAGKIYFFAGTPEPKDVANGAVDILGSVHNELFEETGLDAAEFMPAPGWCLVFAGPRVAIMKMLQAREPAAALQTRIERHIARERQPELAGVFVARSPADLHPRMPDFIRAFLLDWWRPGST
jgi:hypothetical protein